MIRVLVHVEGEDRPAASQAVGVVGGPSTIPLLSKSNVSSGMSSRILSSAGAPRVRGAGLATATPAAASTVLSQPHRDIGARRIRAS
jgi:hypothetical protein